MDCGRQQHYNDIDFVIATAGEGARYTAVTNSDWCDAMYCTTLAISARTEAIPGANASYFPTPQRMPLRLYMSARPGGCPFQQHRALQRITPEESAMP